MKRKKETIGSSKTVARLKERQAQKQENLRQPMLQAMVWYKEEDYQALLTIFDDADQLPPTFAEWLTRAEEKKAEVESEGDQVMKVFIDPETFPQWCQEKGLPRDANARSQLAIEVAKMQAFRL
jgi:hypothetical protein